jgi:hypothetical protein
VIAAAYVAHAQIEQVAGPKLAVDTKIEQRKLPDSLLGLQVESDLPDLPELKGSLLANQLPLIPTVVQTGRISGIHDDLLSTEGEFMVHLPAPDRTTGFGDPDSAAGGRALIRKGVKVTAFPDFGSGASKGDTRPTSGQ